MNIDCNFLWGGLKNITLPPIFGFPQIFMNFSGLNSRFQSIFLAWILKIEEKHRCSGLMQKLSSF